MDSDTIKMQLDSQNSAFRSALDIVLDQFKSGIDLMDTKICELTRSLEFSQAEIADLQGEVRTLRRTESQVKATIEDLKTKTRRPSATFKLSRGL